MILVQYRNFDILIQKKSQQFYISVFFIGGVPQIVVEDENDGVRSTTNEEEEISDFWDQVINYHIGLPVIINMSGTFHDSVIMQENYLGIINLTKVFHHLPSKDR